MTDNNICWLSEKSFNEDDTDELRKYNIRLSVIYTECYARVIMEYEEI